MCSTGATEEIKAKDILTELNIRLLMVLSLIKIKKNRLKKMK